MGKILLTFDLEEFDIVEEYGGAISKAEKIEQSAKGMSKIDNLLNRYGIASTIFTTAHYAECQPHQVLELAQKGHEIASHGYYHHRFEPAHYALSKTILENIVLQPIQGFRMARMATVDYAALHAAGYTYDTSLNPTWLPGRYNYLREARTVFKKTNGLSVLPASVLPFLRFPLFWLSFKNLPLPIFQFLCQLTLKYDAYLVLYFHPWEFVDLSTYSVLPNLVKRIDGDVLLKKLETLICQFQKQGHEFCTIKPFLDTFNFKFK